METFLSVPHVYFAQISKQELKASFKNGRETGILEERRICAELCESLGFKDCAEVIRNRP